jgi:hypothetical protein
MGKSQSKLQQRDKVSEALGAATAGILSDEEIEKIYNDCDTDKDGSLNADEYIAALKQLGRENELTEDNDHDGTIDALDIDGGHNIFKFDQESLVRTTDGCLRFVGTRHRVATDRLCCGLFILFWVSKSFVFLFLVALTCNLHDTLN